MAFEKFAIVRNEVRKNAEDVEVGRFVGGYISDTAHPGLKQRFEFTIEGDEFAALSETPDTREYQIRGIIKREVAAAHAAWIASLAEPAETVEAQSPAVIGGDVTDLDDAAPEFDPDTGGWSGGWGAPPVDGSAGPTIESATISNAGYALDVHFSEAVVSPAAGLDAGFQLTRNGIPFAPDGASQPVETVIRLSIYPEADSGQLFTLSYDENAGDLQGNDGGEVASVEGFEVDNPL